MNGISQWKIALGLAAIFGAGVVSGWVVATKTAKERMIAPMPWNEIAGSLSNRLQGKLDLTPEQHKKMDAIIVRSAKEMQAIHGENVNRIRQGISNRNAQINAILTPEQQKQFEQCERTRREPWRTKDSWRGKDSNRDHRRPPPRDRAATNAPNPSR